MRSLRHAVAVLCATPTVTAVAVLSIALGIGANTAIFSIVNGLILRSLPVRDPDRLVLVNDGATMSAQPWNYAVWEEIRRRPELFDRSATWWFSQFNLGSRGEARFVEGLCASGSFFDMLGVPVLAGRAFSDADDRRGGGADGAVAVISYRFWQDQFHGSLDAVGRTLVINNAPFAIVGVTPEYFLGPEPGRRFDVLVPLNDQPLATGLNRLDNRDWPWLTIVGRLKSGQSLESAQAGLRGVQAQIRAATLPNLPGPLLDRYLRGGFTLTPAAAGDSTLRRKFERPLWTILVVVILVQLITSANIANILLARAAARRYEFALRRALGASPWRIVRQLLTESLVLAGAGAAVAAMLASWGTRIVVHQLSTETSPVILDLSIDWRVLLFTTGVTLATGIVFGVAPAVRACRFAPADALKGHGRITSADVSGLTTGVVIVQVALSTMVVAAAGLFVRSFTSLSSRPLGFVPDHVLAVTIDAQNANVDPARWMTVYQQVEAAVRALPDVADASLSVALPGSANVFRAPVDVSDGVAMAPAERITLGNLVSSGWFSKFGPLIIAGRAFGDGDRSGAPQVAVVNQAFARKFLGGASPLGHTLALPDQMARPGPNVRIEIVGMAADAVVRSLREPIGPAIYLSLAQHDEPFFRRGFGSMNLAVRSRGDSPILLTRSVAAAISAVNPELSVTFRPLTDLVNASLVQERLVARLSALFGALALLLAGLGLYGVTSYTVTRRRTEMGVRMALGASPSSVMRLVLSRVSAMVGIGLLLGVVASVWASQFVAALLYGFEPRDPVTLGGTVAALAMVGGLAGWWPAWRAARIDPARVLREG